MMITVTILFSAVMMIEGSQQLIKALDRPLLISTECSDASQSQWFINYDEQAPPQWVQSNGDLLLPANEWRAYGIMINQCGTIDHSYEVLGRGEQCIGCLLQYFTPGRSEICVGDVLTVTISTNLSRPHGNAFTLDVNSHVCFSGGGGDGIVSCREEEGSVANHTSFSYHVTALNAGTAAIEAHTNYYEVGLHSTRVVVMIRQCVTEADDATNTTATPTDATNTTATPTDATNTTATPTDATDTISSPTEQTPSSESGSGDGSDDGVSPASLPTGDIPPSSVPVKDKEKDNKAVLIPVICTSVVILAVIVIIIAGYMWRQHRIKNKTTDSLAMQYLPANYGVPVAAQPCEEESSAVADGRELIYQLPGNNIMGLVEEGSAATSSQASQES